MGDEAAFYNYAGVASPRIVAALRNLAEPPSNPELLAQLLDAHAGAYIDLKLAGVDARIRQERQLVQSASMLLAAVPTEWCELEGADRL